MGMTITEKILAKHAGKKRVEPGELINARVDLVFANENTGDLAIDQFKKAGFNKVFDPKRVMFVADHFTPPKDISCAQQVRRVRLFAKKMGLLNFLEVGRVGIEHILLPELGLIKPGDLVVGADSHTCSAGALGAFASGVGSTDMAAAMAKGELWFRVPETMKFIYHGRSGTWISGKDLILYTIGQIGVEGARYRAMEFIGEAIDALSLDNRFTMANMAIEAGGKNGIFHVDQKTLTFLKPRVKEEFEIIASDPDAHYWKIIEYDASKISYQVALPHSPGNVKPISEIGKIEIDQVVIGCCTNGRIEDMRVAARILRGKETNPNVRTIIIPGSQEIYLQALQEGLIETFVKAKAAVSLPTCGPCFGGHMGILAESERALATTNRNFLGRMGDKTSEVYLASPAVGAATAIKGYISIPEEVM
ncbi:MAG: 3-isopropylmalate dehydratase large subunit [Thermodesulfobacteriota bacterium]|nr:3-isopropylmalate dehydratase large subunit [Thermodesulfobacteriota bacterium]